MQYTVGWVIIYIYSITYNEFFLQIIVILLFVNILLLLSGQAISRMCFFLYAYKIFTSEDIRLDRSFKKNPLFPLFFVKGFS